MTVLLHSVVSGDFVDLAITRWNVGQMMTVTVRIIVVLITDVDPVNV